MGGEQEVMEPRLMDQVGMDQIGMEVSAWS